ncbi:MAG: hypothetical protein L6Q57_03890 [Alphaproteobacteria bacterium]|nr:hypothetical protein [Alphaproteobacteria bacterium]
MSESGFPQPPGGQRIIPSYTPADRHFQSERVKIVQRPERLENLRHEIRVRGEVTAATPEGRVSIRTPKGEIVVQWPPDAQTPPPQPGTRVEIDIPPVAPPQTQTPQTLTTTAPQEAVIRIETPLPVPDQSMPAKRPTPTPLVIDIRPEAPSEAPPVLHQPLQNPLPALLELIAPERLPNLLPEGAPPGSSFPPVFAAPTPDHPFMPAPMAAEATTAPDKIPLLKKLFSYLKPAAPMPDKWLAAPTDAIAPPVAVAATPLAEALKTKNIALADMMTPDFTRPHQMGTEAAFIAARVIGVSTKNFPVLRLEAPAQHGVKTAPENAPLFLLHRMMPEIMPGMILTLVPVDAASPDHALTPAHGVMPQDVSSTAPLPPLAVPFSIKPDIWPLMNELNTALQNASAPVALALRNMVPNPANPTQIGPAALFFIAVVRSGDLGAWLGERASDTLRRAGRSDLLSRLSQESGQMARTFNDAPTGEWRTAALPLMIDQTIYKMALHIRREDDPEQHNDESKGGHTRFLFDLDFGRLGPLQVDGLLRGPRLDLILRSQQPFAPHMREDMRRLYTRALAETKLEGEIGFQSHPDQWVNVTAQRQNMQISA